MKRAFTIVELMIAMFVGAVALTAVASSFVTSVRMLATAMAESELSLAGRAIRERLLFRASPPLDGAFYAGVLSGSDPASVVEGGSSPNIQMSCRALGANFGDVRSQSMRIMLRKEGSRAYLYNERTPDGENHKRWLDPGGFSLKNGSIGEVVDYLSDSASTADIYRLFVDYALSYGQRYAGGEVVRRERVAVPVLGRTQPLKTVVDGEVAY